MSTAPGCERFRVVYVVDGTRRETGISYSRESAEASAARFRMWCRIVYVESQASVTAPWRKVQQ